MREPTVIREPTLARAPHTIEVGGRLPTTSGRPILPGTTRIPEPHAIGGHAPLVLDNHPLPTQERFGFSSTTPHTYQQGDEKHTVWEDTEIFYVDPRSALGVEVLGEALYETNVVGGYGAPVRGGQVIPEIISRPQYAPQVYPEFGHRVAAPQIGGFR